MAKQTVKAKVRKKKWFHVVAPKFFREQVIGDIHLYDSEQMLNRKLTVNMMNLTGNPRNQNVNVMLIIKEIKEGKGMTEILGYEMMPSSVKRIVRRGRTKVSDSVIIATRDNKKVIIKPLLITSRHANKSAANSIRVLARNTLVTYVSKLTYEKLVEEIITFKLQKFLGNTTAKIAPMRNAEIRAFKLVEKEGVGVIKVAKMRKPVKIKEEEKRAVPEKKEETTEEKKIETKAAPKEKEVATEIKPKPEAKKEVEKKVETPAEVKKEAKAAPEEAKK
ncbi:MAG: hypothetical protein KKF46_01285 [Nanoarchaeota archaeon]|nr:hypothetical protein [Nanoarchaeota archaeon]MBU1320967.1 hypothetical protein [Nanoarchaeota archaeon]MBU1598352.1 hypothetical protein [Nanoarchaeota archaeon]MBU2441746.1 hypothetical protein [Nanoarchaeota archaeon]